MSPERCNCSKIVFAKTPKRRASMSPRGRDTDIERENKFSCTRFWTDMKHSNQSSKPDHTPRA
eukprot:7294121-Karenia_brevis.AAC.1